MCKRIVNVVRSQNQMTLCPFLLRTAYKIVIVIFFCFNDKKEFLNKKSFVFGTNPKRATRVSWGSRPLPISANGQKYPFVVPSLYQKGCLPKMEKA